MDNSRKEDMSIGLCFPRTGEKSDGKLIDIIQKTRESLDIAIFNFTDRKILSAILEAKNQNVEIRIITDKTMSITPIQFFILRKIKKAGIPVKKNSHPGFMHLKITVADRKIVTFASANFTKASQMKNDEFFLTIRNEKMASEVARQFDLMWNNSGDFSPF